MKEKMLNSNHYKRHASLLTIWISVYVLIFIFVIVYDISSAGDRSVWNS